MISYNGGAGIFVDQEAAGVVEDNDLRNNTQGPTAVAPTSAALVTVAKNLSL